MDRKGAFMFAGFALFWTGMVLMFDGSIIPAAFRQYAAQGLPSTTGWVTRSEVTERDSDEGGTMHGVDIAYDYQVDGRQFHGNRYRYRAGASTDSAWAYAAVQAHPVGAEVKVYYRPDRPEESLLKPGLEGADLFMLLFMTPFNVVMVGLWAILAGSRRSGTGPKIAGGVRIISEGMKIRARLSGWSPSVAALASLGLTAFIMMFVVAFFGGGFHPAMRTVLSGWAVVLGVPILVFAWRWWRVNSGAEDMIIDAAAGRVILPRTFGRKNSLSVAFSEIASVQVEKVVTRDNEGAAQTTWSPVLHFCESPGRPGKLAKWRSEQKAASFAGWLRQQVRLTSEPPLS